MTHKTKFEKKVGSNFKNGIKVFTQTGMMSNYGELQGGKS